MTMRTVMVYKRFERIWHWCQMALIMTLLVSGFAVRGIHHLVDFRSAVSVHTLAALCLMVLWLFATFWLFTTGDWRHYLPKREGLLQVARYYAWGIFRGEEHPYNKLFWRKHNPLQALAYMLLKVVLFPAIWITGIPYLLYNVWREQAPGWLEPVVWIHVGAAYAILAFVIVHVYLLTTGHSFVAHVKPMVTGYDEVDLTPAEEAYLQESRIVPMK
ncbi:MAG: cytochrome B [Gammaproteobacteria bacterium HGW-Gammaproteobacteria-1]|jgi:thiosulfate reductase cytochrome b subunit|nr:MAG: cytochrome B [Gammaproteobacteria bacterium HGW-Gammaproteobacteria-1]